MQSKKRRCRRQWSEVWKLSLMRYSSLLYSPGFGVLVLMVIQAVACTSLFFVSLLLLCCWLAGWLAGWLACLHACLHACLLACLPAGKICLECVHCKHIMLHCSQSDSDNCHMPVDHALSTSAASNHSVAIHMGSHFATHTVINTTSMAIHLCHGAFVATCGFVMR